MMYLLRSMILSCIKHFEGLHGLKKAPYVGYGHQLLQGEQFTVAMTERHTDSLLRAELMKRLIFNDYGKDVLLLAVLSYNVGAGRCSDTANIPRADCYGRYIRVSGIFTENMYLSADIKAKPCVVLSKDEKWSLPCF